MNTLPSDQIHAWLASYQEIEDEQLHSAYRELLSDAELRQEQRFYFADDRRRYLVTRALVRTVLSRYEPVAPQGWAFTTNEYGRPHIVAAGTTGTNLVFNVSHTRGLIVLAVARQRELGVDTENIRARSVSVDIADRFFAPDEVLALAEVPAAGQRYRFFEYWTFKESYIKARGMGLSLPLDKFSFRYRHDRTVEIAIHPELADQPGRWQFWQFQPTPEYLVAICAERGLAQSTTLVVRKVIPLVAEEMLAPTLLRTSE